MNFLDVANHFLQNYQSHFPHLGVTRKPSTCKRVVHRKIGCFGPWITILTVRSFQKTCSHFWCISIFILTILSQYRFDFLNQGLNQKIQTCSRQFDWKSIYFDLCVVSYWSESLKKLNHIYYSQFSKSNSSEWFGFFHQGVNRKHSTYRGAFNWNTKGFELCIKTLVIRKVQKVFFNFEYSE